MIFTGFWSRRRGSAQRAEFPRADKKGGRNKPSFSDARHANPRYHVASCNRRSTTKNRGTPKGVPRFLVEATGIEPTTSASRTLRATSCATPRTFSRSPDKRNHYNRYTLKSQTFLCLFFYFSSLKIRDCFPFFDKNSVCHKNFTKKRKAISITIQKTLTNLAFQYKIV